MPGLRRPARFGALAAGVIVLAGATTAAALYTTSAGTSGLLTTASLAAPGNLQAGGTAVVTLSWTATTSTFATGTRILRSTTPGGPYAAIADVTPRTTTTYQDGTVFGGPTYYYVVQAYHRNWTSPQSTQVSRSVSPHRQEANLCHDTTGETSVALPSAPIAGNLLVAVVATYQPSAITAPLGWTREPLVTIPHSPQQAVFYKEADGGSDQTVKFGHVFVGNGAAGVWLFEFSGVPTTLAGSTGSSSGSGNAVGSGSVTVNQAYSLVFAAITSATTSSGSFTDWTAGYTASNLHCNATGAVDMTLGVAWRTTQAIGANEVQAQQTDSDDFVGRILSFGPII
jgi:hypothetical protein